MTAEEYNRLNLQLAQIEDITRIRYQISDIGNSYDNIILGVIKVRIITESICWYLCIDNGLVANKEEMNLWTLDKYINRLKHTNVFKNNDIVTMMETIQDNCNPGLHFKDKQGGIEQTQVETDLVNLAGLVNWFFTKYLGKELPADIINVYKKSAPVSKQENKKEKRSAFVGQSTNVGDIVNFGRYPQDVDGTKRPVEWKILAREGNKALIISRFALEAKPYYSSAGHITWAKSDLHDWLNKGFLQTCFNEEEKKYIQKKNVSADKNRIYKTNSGKTTMDQVFLLSIKQAKAYFNNDQERICTPTEYAISQGAKIFMKDSVTTCMWWLRSPGFDSDEAAIVDFDGSVDYYGDSVNYSNCCVRPVLWVNLES